MYLLKKPSYKIDDFYDELLINRHNNEKNDFLITKLNTLKQTLINAEEQYFNNGENNKLHEITQESEINLPSRIDQVKNNKVTFKDIEKVYSNYFVEKPGSTKIGRVIYYSILANAEYNLCPYCSHREVNTLDHYLPKSQFITFAITPINLLPCCTDCNKEKLDTFSLKKESMLVHPYFENVDDFNWLHCVVKENVWPITFQYSISNNIQNKELESRIQYQFILLGLGKLYGDNAGREFNRRVKSLVKEYNSKKSEEVSRFLEDNIESYKVAGRNSWQTKMFEALKESKWFITEALSNLESFYLSSRK